MKTRLTPKSYMTDEERAEYRKHGSLNLLYTKESTRAEEAGDEDSAWGWLALCELPARSLMILKKSSGSEFIRQWGFNTSRADAAYGTDWLDREES